MLLLKLSVSLAVALGALATPSAARDLKDYPQTAVYRACLHAKAAEYAPEQGSPLELGTIAVGACSDARGALAEALRRDYGASFAEYFLRESASPDAAAVAAAILELRRRSH